MVIILKEGSIKINQKLQQVFKIIIVKLLVIFWVFSPFLITYISKNSLLTQVVSLKKSYNMNNSKNSLFTSKIIMFKSNYL
jgi:hypothetical protein